MNTFNIHLFLFVFLLLFFKVDIWLFHTDDWFIEQTEGFLHMLWLHLFVYTIPFVANASRVKHWNRLTYGQQHCNFFFLTQSCLPHPHSRAWPWLLRVGSCSLAVGQWSSRQTCGPLIRPSVSVSCTPLSCTLGHQDLSKNTTPKHISDKRTLWSFVFLKSLVKILCTLILLHVVNNYADPRWKQCISKDMVCKIVNLCAKISTQCSVCIPHCQCVPPQNYLRFELPGKHEISGDILHRVDTVHWLLIPAV